MNRSTRILWLVIVALVVGLCLVATEANAVGKKSVTVTGCLQKGDEANEFSITGEDGKNYDLTTPLIWESTWVTK